MHLSYPHPKLPEVKHWLQVERPGVPIMLDPYMQVWGKGKIQNYYNFSLKYEDGYWLFSGSTTKAKLNCQKFGYAVLDHFLDDARFTDYLTRWQVTKDKVLTLWSQTTAHDILVGSEDKLTQHIAQCQNLLVEIWGISPLAGVVGDTATAWTDWWFDEKNVPREKRTEYLAALLDYPERSETLKRQDAIAAQLDAVGDNERESVLQTLISIHGYAKSNFSGFTPYTKEDVLHDYAMAKEFTREDRTEERQTLLNDLGASEVEKRIFDRFGYCQYSRDERMSYEQRMFAIIDWCVENIAQRRNLSAPLLRYALTNELTLENLDRSDYLQELERRATDGFLMYWNNEVGHYVIGKEAHDIFAAAGEILDQRKTFPGKIAQAGKAIGRARIIMNPNVPINEDEYILVTSMTSPDFVQHMRRASAIITDEGGITCHAAILSRELNKPCLIGTKIATRSIKDGDLVEVDAENGIVRILT